MRKTATFFYSVLVPDAYFLLYNIPAYNLLNIDLSCKRALLQNICRSMCTFKCRNCTKISSIDIDIKWIIVWITKQFPINIFYCLCLCWTDNLISFYNNSFMCEVVFNYENLNLNWIVLTCMISLKSIKNRYALATF